MTLAASMEAIIAGASVGCGARQVGVDRCGARCELPKIVFSRTLDTVQGNARLAAVSVAEEIAAALGTTGARNDRRGAGLAATAVELGAIDEFRIFRTRPSVAARHFCHRSRSTSD